jgi:hypothetical protein
VLDGGYPDLRGLSFCATATPEEAIELATADPMVRAGRLSADVMIFMTPPGHLVKAGARIYRGQTFRPNVSLAAAGIAQPSASPMGLGDRHRTGRWLHCGFTLPSRG